MNNTNQVPIQLTHFCDKLFKEVIAGSDKSIQPRLRTKLPFYHGTYPDVVKARIWDRYQSKVLPIDYWCYEVLYDPTKTLSTSRWYLGYYANTRRVKPPWASLVSAIENGIKQNCPHPFTYEIVNHGFKVSVYFDFEGDFEQLVYFISPHFITLIEALHPLLMPFIDTHCKTGKQ